MAFASGTANAFPIGIEQFRAHESNPTRLPRRLVVAVRAPACPPATRAASQQRSNDRDWSLRRKWQQTRLDSVVYHDGVLRVGTTCIATKRPTTPGALRLTAAAYGWIDRSGALDTNIAIRTLAFTPTGVHTWGGGGIVADSIAATEMAEIDTDRTPASGDG